MNRPIKSPRKLIEVALPLNAINAEAARSKRKAPAGYPTTLHAWWAQRPLAAARAVIFAQLVNDPGFQQGRGFRYGKNKKDAAVERKRLFKILEKLVKWESTTNEEVLEAARAEIRRSWREVCELNSDHPQAKDLLDPDRLPALHDPFAGGGSIPLEGQRLGLNAFAADLNPVAVLINKALIEIPPRFANKPPVHSDAQRSAGLNVWKGASGLAADLRLYGAWMRDEAAKRIGHLYPKVEITAELAKARPDLVDLVGQQLSIVAYFWARTVKSPSPAFSHVDVPLSSTFVLSNKKGKESWVEPIIDGDSYRFEVRVGTPPASAGEGTKAPGRGSAFRCVLSGAPISGDYIKAEGQNGRMSTRLMAIVADGARKRIHLSPSAYMTTAAASAVPTWLPSGEVPARMTGGTCVPYGLREWSDLFSPRQLVALTTFSDLIPELCELVRTHAVATGTRDDGIGLERGGSGATAYAEAVAVYMAFACSRVADYGSSLATWRPKDNAMRSSFGKQAFPMTWDYAEGSPFGRSSSGFVESVHVVAKTLEFLPAGAPPGEAVQADAQHTDSSLGRIVSTDPPYYDNISYANLSDFFYVWLRRSLRPVFPDLFATMAVPKAEELVANPHRHGSKEKAESFFLDGMTAAMHRLAEQAHPAIPVTIYYAFKQSETKEDGATSSAGWETFLEAVIRAGFAITGTWPVRTESDNRQIGNKANALASSIVLVCRKRSDDTNSISRREFLRELNAVLPEALDEMTKGTDEERSPVDPVDLSQAILGPGMAIFSKYAAVLEADGTPMSVHTALLLINRFLAEDDFDADTQFCLRWFEQSRWSAGKFDEANTIARAKGTSVDGVRTAGVIESGGGNVRMLKWSEYPADWDPETDTRNPVWETLHHLIRALKQDGETGAGRLLAAVRNQAEPARQLAYRLYTLCERKGWAEDARVYNELITSWAGIESAAGAASTGPVQGKLFD